MFEASNAKASSVKALWCATAGTEIGWDHASESWGSLRFRVRFGCRCAGRGAGFARDPTRPGNAVPACVTPGRLVAFLRTRNDELHPRYDGIATQYMRFGEQFGVRWDFAFYQMVVETGALSYWRGTRAGDVRPEQLNFAGLGATGSGARGKASRMSRPACALTSSTFCSTPDAPSKIRPPSARARCASGAS